jgi:hypothetical protein
MGHLLRPLRQDYRRQLGAVACDSQERKVIDETRAHCSAAAEPAITGTRGGRKASAGGTCVLPPLGGLDSGRRGSRVCCCGQRWGAGGAPGCADCAGIRSACRGWFHRGGAARRRSGDRHDAAPAPPRMLRRWPVVTSVAAALAWTIGLLPSSIPHIPWSSPATWLIAAVLGSALLLSIPTAQYLLLRSAIHTAGRWIWVNVLAWSLAICWTLAPSPLVNASTPLLSLIGIYATAGLLMATTIAVITGLCWFSWLRTGVVRTVSRVT